MTPAWIALGSNLGDRFHTLQAAVGLLKSQPGVTLEQVSTFRETAPVGGPADQGPYLNGIARVQTSLTPRQLLQALHAIENQLGRVRTERWGSRTLDMDLVLFGAATIDEPDLQVPHPRLHERAFVLEPMVEIDPAVVHPVLCSTMSDLLSKLRHRGDAHGWSLAGKTAVVTGSTSGIGKAIALTFARAGARVIVHGRRSRDAAEVVAQECGKLGPPPARDIGGRGRCQRTPADDRGRLATSARGCLGEQCGGGHVDGRRRGMAV